MRQAPPLLPDHRLQRGRAKGAGRQKMYTTYILKSLTKDWFYIGHTSNLERRLKEHNSGKSKATKLRRPYRIVYMENFSTKGEAFGREMQIKRFRHGEAFNKLIEFCPIV